MNSVELAIERVKARVEAGGHNIPIGTIKRRYTSGLNNLNQLYIPTCDSWLIFDNSNKPTKLIAKGLGNSDLEVYDDAVYNKILKP